MRLAIEAGVDLVQLYPVDAGHGMRPTEAEQEIYYRFLLDQIDHPVGLSVNSLAGAMAPRFPCSNGFAMNIGRSF